MEDLWNLATLEPPPMVRLQYSKQTEMCQIIVNQCLVKQFDLLESLFNKYDKKFEFERLLLEKIIYKNWNCMRKETTLKIMKILLKAIKKHDSLQLKSLLTKFRTDQADYHKLNIHFVTRELHEYLLVRVYSSHKIVGYACELCVFLYKVIAERLSNAIYLPNNLVFLSTVSRIYAILKKFDQSYIQTYNSIRSNIDSVKKTDINWNDGFDIGVYPLVIECPANDTIPLEIMPTQQPAVEHDQNDFGEVIRREEPFAASAQISSSTFVDECESKWKRHLFKFLKKISKRKSKKVKSISKYLKRRLSVYNILYADFLKKIKTKLIKKLRKNKIKYKKIFKAFEL
jgi:hypothetical protein